MSNPNDDTLSEVAFGQLDDYLIQLQRGRQPNREAVLARYPHLANTLACLEALELLAPPLDLARLNGKRHSWTEAVSAGNLCTGAATEGSFEFGAYEVEGEIGRGGMGVVFKARHKELKRPVALKMILSGQLASPELIKRFQDEARAAAALHHPNIVSIYEAGQQQGQPFFAMQFIGGPSLAKRLEEGPLEPEAAARLIQQIAQAVAHLHQNNIVHRDLKPSNILLDEEGCPYVSDFGLVKVVTGESHRTSTGVIVGTPSYMAPEQASGHAEMVGPLSDVYSLGVILYELLTGRPPFREATPLDTLVQVLEGEPKPPREIRPQVPAELELICLRCLEKEPNQRYPSAAALASDLEKFLKNEVLDLRQPGWRQRILRWSRREPALVSRLVTLTLCCILAQVSFQFFHTITLGLHVQVMGILAGWGVASFICQKLLHHPAWQRTIPFLWSALDMLFFSGLLYLDDPLKRHDTLNNPIIIGYPLLVAASGLWFRIGLIWFNTVIAEIAYILLWVEQYIQTQQLYGLHKHIVFLIGLAVLGDIVAYQVNRVRALSRYYEHRPLP